MTITEALRLAQSGRRVRCRRWEDKTAYVYWWKVLDSFLLCVKPGRYDAEYQPQIVDCLAEWEALPAGCSQEW